MYFTMLSATIDLHVLQPSHVHVKQVHNATDLFFPDTNISNPHHSSSILPDSAFTL
jgi:hypothetical protein